MKCPRCSKIQNNSITRCSCGFVFDEVPENSLDVWFDEVRHILEMAYTVAPTPWQASGKSGSFEEWTRLRIPNLAPVDHPGSYLDIGCANGFLLECLLAWAKLKGVALVPFGLDYSQKMVQLARHRLTRYAANIYHGNVYTWAPPQRYDYVRTELDYVPRNYRRPLIERLLAEFVNPDGKLILSDYRSRRDDLSRDWIGDDLKAWGYEIEETCSGFGESGLELCRVHTLRK